MMRLEGKVAVITGAASGIGEAIAKLFAKEGARVVASDIAQAGLDRVVKEITDAGGAAVGVVANVASEDDVQKMIDTAVDRFGTLDVLVNNAGIMDNFVPAHELTDELWERVLAVNTTGPMRTIRKALPIMMEKGRGSIINVASVAGVGGSRAGAAYTASKHAAIGLTKNVGYQYATLGIRCNAIAPGGVETNIGATIDNPSKFGYERMELGTHSNPRSAQPIEIANVALFLASDESSFVNGAVIIADSGWSAY